MARVLVIGDTHFPAVHPGYLAFCQDLHHEYRCNAVVHIGDVVDSAAVSDHDKDPDAPGAADEYELACNDVAKWEKVFSKISVCEGNHDLRYIRIANRMGIPKRFLREYNELFGTPHWVWATDHTIDDVYYTHGTGRGGLYPAINMAKDMGMSVVSGHIHTAAGIWWKANPLRRWFGMNVGCAIDDGHRAFKYAVNNKVRSIISAAVVIDGVPFHRICPIGPGEKYNKKRFGKQI